MERGIKLKLQSQVGIDGVGWVAVDKPVELVFAQLIILYQQRVPRRWDWHNQPI
jgi:hypothetical protein